MFKLLHLLILLQISTSKAQAQPQAKPQNSEANSSAKQTSGALSYDAGPTYRLTQYRQQHRRTLDGRLCAAGFMEKGQTFTDCTSTKTPDGQTGREWCYVEVQLLGTGSRDWDFCRPVVDYDHVRAVAREIVAAKVQEAERLIQRISGEKKKLDDVIDRYEKTCVTTLGETTSLIESIERTLDHTMHTLENAEEAERSIDRMKFSIEDVERSANSQLMASLKDNRNCRARRGYEDDMEPDGLRGFYFPTPFFSCNGGVKQSRLDPVIDFLWDGTSPATDIPNEAFSVRWEGYIAAGRTGEYKLSTVASCGARLYLNGVLLIADRMPATENAAPMSENGDEELKVPLLPIGMKLGSQKVSSAPIVLNAGDLIPIRLEMIHSSHLLFEMEEQAQIQLLWRGPDMEEDEVIPQAALFSSRTSPVLKLGRLPAATTRIEYLRAGLQPFLQDGGDLYITDLSPEVENAKIIRMYRALFARDDQMLEFDINIPARLFIAHEIGEELPLESCGGQTLHFKETDLILTVSAAASRNARARWTKRLVVEEALLTQAPAGYRFSIAPMRKAEHVPPIVFLLAAPQDETSCSGVLKVVSDPSGSAFESCEASSEASESYRCEFGLNRRHQDKKFGVWKSSYDGGVGQWISVQFNKKIRLTHFKFKPLDDPLQWPAEIRLTFGAENEEDAQIFTIIFSSSLDVLSYPIQPIVSDKIKIEITQMYTHGKSTGGSFEIFGSECQMADFNARNQALRQSVPMYEIADCYATLNSLEDLKASTIDQTIDFQCPANCFNKAMKHLDQNQITHQHQHNTHTRFVHNGELDENDVNAESENLDEAHTRDRLPLYGTAVYSADSSICFAALHENLCDNNYNTHNSRNANLCQIQLTIINGQNHYTATNRFGIQSHVHGPHERSFVLQPRAADGKANHHALKHNKISTELLILFGAHPQTHHNHHQSDIDDSRAGGSHADKDAIEMERNRHERKVTVLHDAGTIYSVRDDGHSYGWLREAPVVDECPSDGEEDSGLENESAPALNGGVEFPPAPQHELCVENLVDCSPNAWSIKVRPNAKFNIVATLGNTCQTNFEKLEKEHNGVDPGDEATAPLSGQILQVNGKTIGSKLIKSGQVAILKSKDVHSGSDGKITLTAVCQQGNESEHCSKVHTTIIALKIVEKSR